MPPRRRLKKVSVKRLVEKRVAKAIEEYEKSRVNLDSAGSSGGNNGNAGKTVNVQGELTYMYMKFCRFKKAWTWLPICVEATIAIGAKHGHLIHVVNFAINIKSHSDIPTLIIAAKTVGILTSVEKIFQIKERLITVRSRQKSYADKKSSLLNFEVGDSLLLSVPPWKGVELSCVHDTFHVSNLKKCLAEPDVQVPLDEIEIDENLRFVEEPIEIVERDVKKLKRRRIPPMGSKYVILGKELEYT
ncbi:putative reverse transcriptase domain-containing protein [Tanacetum coccineum]